VQGVCDGNLDLQDIRRCISGGEEDYHRAAEINLSGLRGGLDGVMMENHKTDWEKVDLLLQNVIREMGIDTNDPFFHISFHSTNESIMIDLPFKVSRYKHKI
jgi:hypothetical protein